MTAAERKALMRFLYLTLWTIDVVDEPAMMRDARRAYRKMRRRGR